MTRRSDRECLCQDDSGYLHINGYPALRRPRDAESVHGAGSDRTWAPADCRQRFTRRTESLDHHEQGSITGGHGRPIALAAGGIVTNTASAFLRRPFWRVDPGHARDPRSVTIAGTISAIKQARPTPRTSRSASSCPRAEQFSTKRRSDSAQGAGVDILSGAGTVVRITGRSAAPTYDGVYLDHGSVTNKRAERSPAPAGTSGTLAGGGTVAPSGWVSPFDGRHAVQRRHHHRAPDRRSLPGRRHGR